ncbi:MAG: LuxR C-terminal-related transcriptional regulator [Myxococcota bacterium]
MAELLGALSLATDLADGFSLEKCLRTAILATRLARLASSDPEVAREAYWASLLRFLGCTAFAHEESERFAAGDDLGLRKTLAFVDFGRPSTFAQRALRDIAAHAPLPARARALLHLLQPTSVTAHAAAQCEVGAAFAESLAMPKVAAVLRLRDERWDGRGPRKLASEEALPLSARLADVADTAELYAWSFGLPEALDELRRRRGGQLDPRLTDLCLAEAPALFSGLDQSSVWELFLETEPAPQQLLEGSAAIDEALQAFSRFADIGSVYTLGHSEEVGALAGRAAAAAGLSSDEQALARQAGYTHDLGRVAVPNGIWEKRERLTPFERERIRTHSQHTETILRLSSALGPLVEIAASAHERGQERGYHRRLRISSAPMAARILSAADMWIALRSERPHRPAYDADRAEAILREEAKSGALDPRAVEALLDALRGPAPKPRARPAPALTERELEVLRWVAIGRTNKEIGQLLGISDRTAQKHVMHIYQKLGLESRAGLALYAMEHGLLH